MTPEKLLAKQLAQYGVFRLSPVWVPRAFCRPGKRIRLHPADYYALGLTRGGIDERWFASTTHADNGPDTPDDEGLSYILLDDGEKILLREAVDIMKDTLVGSENWQQYGAWPMYSKFFDNAGPLPHHIHHRDRHARLVGQNGKPEMYFFPAQVNNHHGEFPFTFFGFNPETTQADVKKALVDFEKGDNNILGLSRAYKLEIDTGWDVPPGILHAPGSLCTYEPQRASDVYAMFQSVLYGGQCVPPELLWKDCPPEKRGDFDYLMDVIDWPENVAPDFHEKHYMRPQPAAPVSETAAKGYTDEWICYKTREVSAKRLTLHPGADAVIQDAAPYGLIILQGHGTLNGLPLENATLIRYGQYTYDEYFVSAEAAQKGVRMVNQGQEDMVILKHFGLNPDIDKHGLL